jgi:hypothetical protein
MNQRTVIFTKNQVVSMAQYLIEITKLGAAYQVINNGEMWTVEITGY